MALRITHKDGSMTRLQNGEIAERACAGTIKRTGAPYELDVKNAWDRTYYKASGSDGEWDTSKVGALRSAGFDF